MFFRKPELRQPWGLCPWPGLLALLLLFAAPPAPVQAASVTLAWDANSEPDLAGYILRWGTASGNYTAQTNLATVTTNTVSGLAAGTTYHFAVSAYNTSGLESGPSAEVVYTVPGANRAPVVYAGTDQIIPLNHLALLNGSAQDDGLPNPPGRLATAWSWTSIDGQGEVTLANSNAVSTTARFSLEGFYQLKLTAGDGELSASHEIMVVVLPADDSGPVVSEIKVGPVTPTNAWVSWNTTLPADSFVQFGPTTYYGYETRLDPTRVTVHQVVLSNLVPNATYHCRAVSTDAAGNQTYSEDVVFITQPLATEISLYLPVSAAAAALGSPMQLYDNPQDPQQKFIQSAVALQGTATYRFEVASAADYVIWCRVLSSNTNRDSFFVSVDGGTEEIYDAAQGSWSSLWRWNRITGRTGSDPLVVAPRLFSLAAGSHTLTVRAREAFTRLSRLLITSDLDFIPVDSQPVETIATAATLTNLVVKLDIGPGYSMIANPLRRGGNTLDEVLPRVPEGTRFFKFNSALRNYTQSTFQGGHWIPAGQTLAPGEGAFIYNVTAARVSLVFTGQPELNPTPRQFGPGLYMISSLYLRSGRISELLDFPLRNRDTVFKFDSARNDYTTCFFDSGMWYEEPVIEVGEAFFFERVETE